MEITWLGHSCFRIKGRELTVITDPYDKSLGYPSSQVSGNVVTSSHPHPGHSYVAGVSGRPKLISGPGEYEVAEAFITGISTFHDAEQGQVRGKNTVYLIEMEEMVLCHLGDLGHVPTPEQVERMSGVEVLLVPVGGASTIDAAAAAKTVRLLEPKVVIPMHFKTEMLTRELEPVTRFLKEMGLTDIEPRPKFSAKKSSLPSDTQVILLDCRR